MSTMVLKKFKTKKISLFIFSALFAVQAGLFPITASAQSSTSVDCSEFLDFTSRNDDRAFFNPCAGSGGACAAGSGSLTGPAPTELSGESNAEKTWNYFVGRGLTPIAAAGALGNIEQESGFDPWIGESGSTSINKGDLGVGFGLIQWTNTEGNTQGRRYGVMKYMEDNGVSLNATDPSQLDKALLSQLNYLWDGEYGSMTWQEEVNAETKIEGNTSIGFSENNVGNGTALLFHALVERSGDGPEGKQERIDSAKKYLEQFGAGGGECTIGEGGLTEDQAKKLMDYYRNLSDSEAQAVEGMDWFFNPGPSDCWGKPNCTAFSTFFVGKYTSLAANASGNGNQKVDELLAINPGAKSGTTPQPFAVFQTGGTSGFGHTGIILGISGDTAIIGEASCGDGPEGILARTVTVESISTGYKYMYTDGTVQNDILMGDIGG